MRNKKLINFIKYFKFVHWQKIIFIINFILDKRDSGFNKSTSKKEIYEFFVKHTDVKSPNRGKFSIHIISKGKNDDLVKQKEKEIKYILEKSTIINGVYYFRNSQIFGPSPISYKPIEEYLVD